MIALVFNVSMQNSLCEMLEKAKRIQSRLWRAICRPLSCLSREISSVHRFLFSLSVKSKPCITILVAVGNKDEEALLAFSHNASGFVKSPLEESQVLNAIEHVKTKYHFYERDFQFNMLVKGLVNNMGCLNLRF